MKWLKIAIIALLLLPITSCSRAWEYEAVDYTLKLYYLGGSTEIKTMPFWGRNKPEIYSDRGSYTLRDSRSEGTRVKGGVRFEILSKSEPYIIVRTDDGKYLTPQQAKEQGYHIFINH